MDPTTQVASATSALPATSTEPLQATTSVSSATDNPDPTKAPTNTSSQTLPNNNDNNVINDNQQPSSTINTIKPSNDNDEPVNINTNQNQSRSSQPSSDLPSPITDQQTQPSQPSPQQPSPQQPSSQQPQPPQKPQKAQQTQQTQQSQPPQQTQSTQPTQPVQQAPQKLQQAVIQDNNNKSQQQNNDNKDDDDDKKQLIINDDDEKKTIIETKTDDNIDNIINNINNMNDDDDDDNISIGDILPSLNLPVVDSLQPDELCLTINQTINKISKLNPKKDAKIIMAYKSNLIQQLERLQNISAAIESLNDMEKTASSLPSNSKTGYPNTSAIDLALREHCFFAEQISVFGMLLIEISDIKSLTAKYTSEYTNALIISMCETIETQFIYQHMLFHYSTDRLVILVYISDENELLCAGKEIIRLLTSHSFEIKDQILHSNVSIGAAIYKKEQNTLNNDDNTFDFRTWMKNAELGLNKANNSNNKNQCCISHSQDNNTITAIMSGSGNNNDKQHANHKSSLSLLARSKGKTHSHSSSSYGKLKLSSVQHNFTPQEIRSSIRLYDKLTRLHIKMDDDDNNGNNGKQSIYLNKDNYKLISLSLCRRFREQGANYNFQNPKHNGNSILMLCCIKNLEIVIKYFCTKLKDEIDFNLTNNDGNNALMLAILNKYIGDNTIKLLIKNTEKTTMNHDGKMAKQLAEEMQRNDLVALLSMI